MEDLKRSYWADAGVGGGVIGVIVVIVNLLSWKLGGGAETSDSSGGMMALTVVYYFAVIFATGYFARMRGQKHGDSGFGYSQALGYIVSMMLFAGFIDGLGQWMLYNYIDTELPRRIIEQTFASMTLPGIEQKDAIVGLSMSMLKNPLVMMLGGVFGGAFKGLILGLVMAAFTRRQPNMR
jgi:hypothetical protein